MQLIRQEIRDLAAKAAESGNAQYANDIAQRYTSVVIPLTQRIREAKYARLATVPDGATASDWRGAPNPFKKRLVAEPFTLSELVAPVGPDGAARVIAFQP